MHSRGLAWLLLAALLVVDAHAALQGVQGRQLLQGPAGGASPGGPGSKVDGDRDRDREREREHQGPKLLNATNITVAAPVAVQAMLVPLANVSVQLPPIFQLNTTDNATKGNINVLGIFQSSWSGRRSLRGMVQGLARRTLQQASTSPSPSPGPKMMVVPTINETQTTIGAPATLQAVVLPIANVSLNLPPILQMNTSQNASKGSIDILGILRTSWGRRALRGVKEQLYGQQRRSMQQVDARRVLQQASPSSPSPSPSPKMMVVPAINETKTTIGAPATLQAVVLPIANVSLNLPPILQMNTSQNASKGSIDILGILRTSWGRRAMRSVKQQLDTGLERRRLQQLSVAGANANAVAGGLGTASAAASASALAAALPGGSMQTLQGRRCKCGYTSSFGCPPPFQASGGPGGTFCCCDRL